MKRVLQSTQRPVLPARHRVLAALTALISFAIYSTYSFFQYKHFVTPSWDLGIFSQLAQAYARGEFPPIVPVKGAGFNLWGDHFHPILIVLAPFYWVFPSPATLLYVQNALVALSIYFLALFALRLLKPIPALLISTAYALSYGIQNAISVQFHEVAFALPFLVLSLGNLACARFTPQPFLQVRKAVLWAMPLVFVKEDLGITVLAIGVVALIRTRSLPALFNVLVPLRSENQKTPTVGERLSAASRTLLRRGALLESFMLLIWGVAWAALAVGFILPFFNNAGQFDYADKIDVGAAVADPLGAFSQLFYPWVKSKSLGLLLLAGAGAWICSPIALVALPTLIWRFLSPNHGYWESTWHYSLVLMPVVFVALVDAIQRCNDVVAEGKPHRTSGSASVRYSARDLHLFDKPAFQWVFSVVAFGVAAAMLPQAPIWSLTKPAFATTQLSATDQMKQQAVDAIPAGAVVASDLSILTYLVHEHTVYWISHEGEPAPDYVVIDRAGTAWGGNPPKDPASYANERYPANYQVERQIGSIFIVKRVE